MKYLKTYENIFSIFKKKIIDPNNIYTYNYEDVDISVAGDYSSEYRLIVGKITINDKDYNEINGYYLDNGKETSKYITSGKFREAKLEEIEKYNQFELQNVANKYNL